MTTNRDFDAVLFDLDGVLTSTASLHDPRLPDGWERLRFRLQIRGQLIEVEMTREGTDYRLLEGRGLLIYEGDREIRLAPRMELAIAA